MLTVLLAALAFHHAAPQSPRCDEIFVRTASPVSAEALASATAPFGTVKSRNRGTSLYLVRLNPGVDAERVRTTLEKIPGIHPLEPSEEPVDMNSMRSLERKIAHLKKQEKPGEKEEENGLDYLEAYHYFVGQRAFPNDSVDWSAYARAQRHVAQMRPAALPTKRLSSTDSINPFWTFVGPTNLGTPYRQYFGLPPVSGRINAVAYDPNHPLIVYAGAAQGGLWQSMDGGFTWTWLSSSWSQLGVSCIVIDPTNSNTIYVGMGDYPGFISNSFGIMKSTDGGQSWSEIATAFMGQIGVPKVLIDPTNHNTLIAGTGDQFTNGAVYRSTDGGTTWTTVISNDSSQFRLWPTLAASVPNAGNVRLYAIAAGWGNTSVPTSRFYVSDDHGATWQNPPSPVNTDGSFHRAYWVCTSPTSANTVYVLDSENAALYSSSSQGATWNNLSANLPTQYPNLTQTWYNYYIECGSRVSGSTSTDVLYFGEVDVAESVDGGNSWQSLGGPTYDAANAVAHNDQHAFAVCPSNPNQSIFSGDGGFYSLSYDPSTGQNTVSSLSKNLGVTMFYKIAAHPTNPNFLIGGSQDNASPFAAGDIANWLNAGGGDGGGCAINQANPLIGYVTAQPTNGVAYVTRSEDGWESESFIPPPTTSTENLAFVSPITLAPSDQTKMYWGSNYLYLWDDAAQQWTPRLGNQILTGSGNSSAVISAIAVAPTDANRIYTGSNDGALWMTTNRGKTWIQLNSNGTSLPNNRSISSISVSSTSASDILVGLSGTGASHLWRCSNTAAASPSFANASGTGPTSLPDVSLNAIARDLDMPASTWWVGTDIGVFRSTDSGATWLNAGTSLGLPSCIVDDLAAVPGTRYLNAGTYGCGMWRLSLPIPPPPLTNLTVMPKSVIGGASAEGTVTLGTSAPSGGTLIDLTSSSASASVPLTVTVPQGSTTASFTISTTGVLSQTGATITASQGTETLTADLTIQPTTIITLSASPNPVVGGTDATGQITLSGPAPPNGVDVSLASNNPNLTVPTTVRVVAGASSATFVVSTTFVAAPISAIVSAVQNTQKVTTTVNVQPTALVAINLAPSSVVGSSTTAVTGTLVFDGPTPPAGVVVTLKSSSVLAAKLPTSLKVLLTGSQRTVAFTVSHYRVQASKAVTITASTVTVTRSTVLAVTPFGVASFSIEPTTIIGGNKAVGTVALNAEPGAKSGAISVKLSSKSRAASFPSTLSLPASGPGSKTFSISTLAQNSTTSVPLFATLDSSSQTATLEVLAPDLSGLKVSPNSVKGSSTTAVTGTATLSGLAPSTGFLITLTSSDSSAASVPASLRIAPGRSFGTFIVKHKKVATTAAVTITATHGSVSETSALTVTP